MPVSMDVLRVLSRRMPRFLTVREWDCAIVMLKAVDGQRVGLCYRHAEGC